jgi:hypothetical protein
MVISTYIKETYSSYPLDVTSPGPDQRAGTVKATQGGIAVPSPNPMPPAQPAPQKDDQAPKKCK